MAGHGPNSVDVAAVHYPLRPIKSWTAFATQLRSSVMTAASSGCAIVLLPELFGVQLLSTGMPLADDLAAEVLAMRAERIQALLLATAAEAGVVIVAGGHPTRRGAALYNAAWICTPDGTVHSQDKLHMTPWEADRYRLVGGDHLRIFDVDGLRFAVLVCYDIEFPELARQAAAAGVEVILVPFCTDDAAAFTRVQVCARARAIENGVYVVAAGLGGGTPEIFGFERLHGGAFACSPSDAAFPVGGFVAHARDDGPGALRCALDLARLRAVRAEASVRPWADPRTDLFTLTSTITIEHVRLGSLQGMH